MPRPLTNGTGSQSLWSSDRLQRRFAFAVVGPVEQQVEISVGRPGAAVRTQQLRHVIPATGRGPSSADRHQGRDWSLTATAPEAPSGGWNTAPRMGSRRA